MADVVAVTISVDFRPWNVPNFLCAEDRGTMSLREAPTEALDAMAQRWIDDLYEKAGRRPPRLVNVETAT